MTQYISRRVLYAIPSLLVVVTVTFILLRVAPGDVVQEVFANSTPKAGQIERMRAELSLDQPIYIQYFRWLGQLAMLDFGYSVTRNSPVVDLIQQRLPNSMRLGVMAILIGWCIAIPIGIIAAVRQDTWFDSGFRSLAITLDSVPGFVMAILVLVVPASLFGWAPPLMAVPFQVDPWGHLLFLLTPAIMIGINSTGTLMRMTRAMLLEVLRADYIRTARAKGLGERRIVLGHALKNALIPVVTILGGQLSGILGGSVIMENMFGVPGMGNLALSAVNSKDIAVVQTVNVFFGAFILLSNLLVDISYAWLDPRIRYR